MHWVYLALAVLAEVAGTTSLRYADGFTRPMPTMAAVTAFMSSMYFLSLTLRAMPIGMVYAIWAGAGIALVSLVGAWLFDQRMDGAAVAGIALIGAGIATLHIFSTTTQH